MAQTTIRFSDEAASCADCRAQEFTIDAETGLIVDPGKFEAEPLAAWHAYHVGVLDGGEDESDGSAWLIGNVICEESEIGFVGCDIYDTDEAARSAWDSQAPHEQHTECGFCANI